METSGSKLRPCPRCGALNDATFDRCIRCAAPLGALASGATALKTSAGATLDAQKVWGTKILIALTALVFAAQLAAILARGSLFPGIMSGGTLADILRAGAMLISIEAVAAEPFRLLSAVFVHFGLLHFLMNMVGLASTGRVVEPAIGTARFVFAYLACGVLGFAANIAFEAILPHRGMPVPTAGASGAVFGVMGMTLGWLVRMRDRRWRWFAFEIAFYAAVVNLLVRNINNSAHIGGALAGVAFGFYFAGRPRPRSHLPANVAAVVGLVLVVASLVLAQRSPLGRVALPI